MTTAYLQHILLYPDDSKLYPFKEDEYQAVDKLGIEARSMHMMERHAIDSYNGER